MFVGTIRQQILVYASFSSSSENRNASSNNCTICFIYHI